MDKFEFQINYYFNMYKDEPLKNSKDFKRKFIKKHGKFRYLNEVVLRINKYQVKKYGSGLIMFSDFLTDDELIKKNIRDRVRYFQNKKQRGIK